MVTDFKHLGWLKNFLDDNLDHKFIIDRNDPLFNSILNGSIDMAEMPADNNEIMNVEVLRVPGEIGSSFVLETVPAYVPGTDTICGHTLNVNAMSEGPLKEFYEGFFLVDFLPTSENLSKWVWEVVDTKMSLIGVKTARIDWFETPKSRSSYSGD